MDVNSEYMEQIKEAAKQILNADALLICAGAGMGVDSGLPDFRGNQGFWKAYPPFAKLGYSFIDMANPQWFERDPQLAWGFYGHRLNLYRSTIPHQGFELLLKWGKQKPGGYFVFTSNVDGQFQSAGYDDDCINECHGSIHHFQCSQACTHAIWNGENENVKVDESVMRAEESLPRCPHCGAVARPNILMFGDWGWVSHRTEVQQERMDGWLNENRGQSIVIIECGAGTGVPTVRMTSERIVSRYKAFLIRINVREPRVPAGHIGIASGALEVLSRIEEILEGK